MSNKAWWAVAVLGALCTVFMLVEIGFWPFVAGKLTTFSETVIQATWGLGINQGVYNGFLAAGLFWALFAPPDFGRQLALFFTACVLVAGLVGGLSIHWHLYVAQSVPAAIVLFFLLRRDEPRRHSP